MIVDLNEGARGVPTGGEPPGHEGDLGLTAGGELDAVDLVGAGGRSHELDVEVGRYLLKAFERPLHGGAARAGGVVGAEGECL